MKGYPVGKAQQQVLTALELTASGFAAAERKFEKLGLVVTSKRQGRKSVPVITILNRETGALNANGEGVAWQQYPDANFENIQHWVEE